MKWNKAIEKIEQALAEDHKVIIEYHRKWMKNDYHSDTVDNICEYEWQGQICKAVNTYNDQINESSHIIDAIAVDWFDLTKETGK